MYPRICAVALAIGLGLMFALASKVSLNEPSTAARYVSKNPNLYSDRASAASRTAERTSGEAARVVAKMAHVQR